MVTVHGSYYRGGGCYNREIIGEPLDVTDESTGNFEYPISIDDVKDYLRLEGYIDTDESTADELSDFDFDDTLIASNIKTAVQLFEQTTWLSLRPKTLKWCFTNLCGNVMLPFGPHGDVVSLLDEDDEEIETTSYKLRGLTFKSLEYPCNKNMIITMNVGYGTSGLPELPEPIKMDLLRFVAYIYENRGDDPNIQAFGKSLAGAYSRKPFIA